MSFAKGFNKARRAKIAKDSGTVNTAQYSTMDSENKAMYPAPNTMQNVSGSDKVAFQMPTIKAPVLKAPAAPQNLLGAKGGLKPSLGKPARVDHPSNLSITGVSKSLVTRHKFGGGKPKNLQSVSAAKGVL